MQAGDLRALDALARTYSRRLMAVARRRCHSASDAEDAVQQALLEASDSMTSIRGEGDAVAWLSTLVARSCFRMNECRDRFTLTPTLSLAGEGDPHVSAERRELSDELERALMALSRTDRLAFLLSVDGLDSVEIAEHLGLTHDAVRSRLKRVRARLRDTLETLERTARHDHSPEAALPAVARHR
ncbi:MAG: sigma-70 family RNA polymerase sigma factor [Archangium sp.]